VLTAASPPPTEARTVATPTALPLTQLTSDPHPRRLPAVATLSHFISLLSLSLSCVPRVPLARGGGPPDEGAWHPWQQQPPTWQPSTRVGSSGDPRRIVPRQGSFPTAVASLQPLRRQGGASLAPPPPPPPSPTLLPPYLVQRCAPPPFLSLGLVSHRFCFSN
jgi:hypothetical protein